MNALTKTNEVTSRVLSIIGDIKPGAAELLAANEASDLINDLGFDSVNVLDLIVQIERLFEVDLQIDQIRTDDLRTVEKICHMIQKHKAP